MYLRYARSLKEYQTVMMDPKASGDDPVYWVYSDLDSSGWKDMTVLTNHPYGIETPKTFGHYHQENHPLEKYKIVSGNAVFVLQSKFMDGTQWIENKATEVLFVNVNAGEEITISPKWGHSMSNLGNTPLITFDDWDINLRQNYEPIKTLHGLAYYLIKDGKNFSHVPNPNYLDLPEPKYLSAEEFAKSFSK